MTTITLSAVAAALLLLPLPRHSLRRVGGIWFARIGRLQVSFCLTKGA